ncbi:hypothetical protein Ddye_029966 [Dipteronia dyeriana]|uniref:Uncharacterized protein n=1 Tax=Dipteronia dyeriana TaxID=168575 RepID=A0AAD9WL25_9ROSI|nr:hypothetical protein Ddye_029966 [Dipteronia dyeriana]
MDPEFKDIPEEILRDSRYMLHFKIIIITGWEGTAHDARIFLTTMRNHALNFPKPHKGKYYLVVTGYPQMDGYLGPYKGERYYLPDFLRGSQPTGYLEVFNHAHFWSMEEKMKDFKRHV